MSKLNAVLARNVSNVAKSVCGFSHTVAFSHYNNLSAQLPVDKNGTIVSTDIKAQTKQCMSNIEKIIKGINHKLTDIVRLTIFATNMSDLLAAEKVVETYFKSYKPALTKLVVNKLPLKAKVQIEAVITCGEGTIPKAPQKGDLIKLARNTNLVAQFKNSTHTVAFSHYNHLSAQLPVNTKGKLVSSDLREQVVQALNNIKSILISIDVPFDDIVKLNVYTTSLKSSKTILEVHKTFFPDSSIARAVNYLPALSIIEVKELPLGAKVQIEAVISHGDGTPPQLVEDRHGIVIKHSNCNKVPKNEFASHSVAFSHYNNISQILPVDSKNKLVAKDFDKQLTQCMTYLNDIVKNIKHSMSDVVKINFFVTNINDAERIQQLLKKWFPKTLPAGRVVEVKNLGYGSSVAIDAIVSNAEGTPPEWK